jgi:hypothetical protein
MNKKIRDYPEMSSKVRKELDEYYAPTVRRVESIMGRRIDAWRARSVQTIKEPETA